MRSKITRVGLILFAVVTTMMPLGGVYASGSVVHSSIAFSNGKVPHDQPSALVQLVTHDGGARPQTSYSKQQVEAAVDFASKATGVRKEFLIGMLMVESNMGQNTGQCTYGQVETDADNAHGKGRLSSRAWENFQQRRDTIKDIAKGLHYDYENLLVSCTPSTYAGTGGAMGIGQFMPDTWLEYKDRISAIVGKDNPDPWDVRDGVVAMAVKLADIPGVVDHQLFAERNAAKMYLSGTTSGQYDWYANRIMYWANNYGKMNV